MGGCSRQQKSRHSMSRPSCVASHEENLRGVLVKLLKLLKLPVGQHGTVPDCEVHFRMCLCATLVECVCDSLGRIVHTEGWREVILWSAGRVLTVSASTKEVWRCHAGGAALPKQICGLQIPPQVSADGPLKKSSRRQAGAGHTKQHIFSAAIFDGDIKVVIILFSKNRTTI